MCLLLNTAAIKRQKLMFFQHSRRVCRVSNLNQLFREFFWWSAAWFCSKWWLVAVNFLFLSLLFPQERPEANNYQSCFFFWRFLILLHEGIFCSIIYKKKKIRKKKLKEEENGSLLICTSLPCLVFLENLVAWCKVLQKVLVRRPQGKLPKRMRIWVTASFYLNPWLVVLTLIK